MSNRVLEVHLLGGDHNGEIAMIPRITLSPSLTGIDFAINLKRRQFPIQLAFAMTINKAQGQSVHRVSVDLQKAAFGHGQFCTSPSHVQLPFIVSRSYYLITATFNQSPPQISYIKRFF
jgi:hypothetical protein